MTNTLVMEFVPFSKEIRESRKEIFKSHNLSSVPSTDERDGRSSVRQLVCKSSGKIVGVARWQVDQWGFKVDYFAVHAEECGKGIGAQMVQALIQDIKNAEEGTMQIYCQSPNSTQGFFSALNFKKKGEHFWKFDELCTFFCLTSY